MAATPRRWKLVVLVEVQGGDPVTLRRALQAWAQQQQFRALAGSGGGDVGTIDAGVVPLLEEGETHG